MGAYGPFPFLYKKCTFSLFDPFEIRYDPNQSIYGTLPHNKTLILHFLVNPPKHRNKGDTMCLVMFTDNFMARCCASDGYKRILITTIYCGRSKRGCIYLSCHRFHCCICCVCGIPYLAKHYSFHIWFLEGKKPSKLEVYTSLSIYVFFFCVRGYFINLFVSLATKNMSEMMYYAVRTYHMTSF